MCYPNIDSEHLISIKSTDDFESLEIRMLISAAHRNHAAWSMHHGRLFLCNINYAGYFKGVVVWAFIWTMGSVLKKSENRRHFLPARQVPNFGIRKAPNIIWIPIIIQNTSVISKPNQPYPMGKSLKWYQ